MNDVFELLNVLGQIVAELAREATGETVRALRAARMLLRRLTTITRAVIAWPFVLLIVARFWPRFVPAVAVLALCILLWTITTTAPLAILIGQSMLSSDTRRIGRFVKAARKATNAIRVIVGIELLAGIYLSVVPVKNDPRLALILILVMAAIVAFIGVNKRLVMTLAAAAALITFLFYWEGGLGEKVGAAGQHILQEGEQNTPRPQPQDKPPAGVPAPDPPIEQPLAPARPNGGAKPDQPLDVDGQSESSPAEIKTETPPAQTAPTAIMPTSGDEGSLMIRMTSCRYIKGGVINCWGYMQSRDFDNPVDIDLGDSSGVMDRGPDEPGTAFSVWLFGESIQFIGGGSRARLVAGVRHWFVIKFRAPSGVQSVDFTLHYAGSDANWIPVDFTGIPVHLN